MTNDEPTCGDNMERILTLLPERESVTRSDWRKQGIIELLSTPPMAMRCGAQTRAPFKFRHHVFFVTLEPR
jgi:hypothetical protein